MKNITNLIRLILAIFLVINIGNSIILIIQVGTGDICQKQDGFLSTNIFNLLLYSIGMSIVSVFYKMEPIRFPDEEETIQRNIYYFMVIFYIYLFWHSIVLAISFLTTNNECLLNRWILLKICSEALTIIYSLLSIIVFYSINHSIKKSLIKDLFKNNVYMI